MPNNVDMYSCDYFAPSEFRKCIPACEKSQMSTEFLKRLNKVRYIVGLPFKLNSAFRSPEYELSHKRTGKGYHTKGRAVDIACRDSHTRMMIVRTCLNEGLTVGIGSNFLHIDDRDIPILFHYY